MREAQKRELNMLVCVHIMGWQWKRGATLNLCGLIAPEGSGYSLSNSLPEDWEVITTIPPLEERYADWWRISFLRTVGGIRYMPDYCRDLNACALMEEKLGKTIRDGMRMRVPYVQALNWFFMGGDMLLEWGLVRATPLQKVEAALRAYGVWPSGEENGA